MSATYNIHECAKCIKEDTCKYKEHYELLVGEVTRFIESKDTNLITNSPIWCNFYKDKRGSFR